MSELKPCPFCGRTATMRDDMGHSTAVYFGCSSDLGCLGSDQWAETEEEAVAMWNTRADRAADEITRLRAELAEAQQAEKDWIKVANDLTTHLEKAERQRDAAWAEALEEAARVAENVTGWLGNPYRSNMDFGPNVSAKITSAIRALGEGPTLPPAG